MRIGWLACGYLAACGRLGFDAPPDATGSEAAGNRDIYLTTRTAVGQPFSPPVPVAGLNTAAGESDPWLSPDGHLMVFATNRIGSCKIYQASR